MNVFRQVILKLITRPSLDLVLLELAQALIDANPSELGHIRTPNILFVAGAARRANRASIRPMKFHAGKSGEFKKPKIQIAGKEILYEICLRPRFFLQGNAQTRIQTVAHELWHISPAFDGTLEESRRHHNVEKSKVDAISIRMVKHTSLSPRIKRHMAYKGELTMKSWITRPPSRIPIDSDERLVFDETDLFENIIVQKNDS